MTKRIDPIRADERARGLVQAVNVLTDLEKVLAASRTAQSASCGQQQPK